MSCWPTASPTRQSSSQCCAWPTAARTGPFCRRTSPRRSLTPRSGRSTRPLLTPRELEILACLGEGMSNKAVARRLGISAHTVKFHLEAVFTKLGVTSRAEAVAKGLRRGLILL
jgi:DNA-binding CsgD family transcriptional regulator